MSREGEVRCTLAASLQPTQQAPAWHLCSLAVFRNEPKSLNALQCKAVALQPHPTAPSKRTSVNLANWSLMVTSCRPRPSAARRLSSGIV